MYDRINLNDLEYNELLDKLYVCCKGKENEPIPGVSLPKFTLNVLESPFLISFNYDVDTKILITTIFEKEQRITARFTTMPIDEICWGGSFLTDIVWDKKSDATIVKFFNEKRNFNQVGYVPDVLKNNVKRYHSLITTFQEINKALLCLPSIWKKQSVDTEPKVQTPESKLQKAIFGNNVFLRNVYTIKSFDSIVRAKPKFNFHCECWNVRGHIRHLSNGREVFVNAYQKGAKRGVSAPKTKDYVLNEKD